MRVTLQLGQQVTAAASVTKKPKKLFPTITALTAAIRVSGKGSDAVVLPTLQNLNALSGVFRVSLSSHSVMVLLSKAGFHGEKDFLRQAQAFFKKASKQDLQLLVPSKFMTQIRQSTYSTFDFGNAGRGGRMSKTAVMNFGQNMAYLYAYALVKLCSVVGATFKADYIHTFMFGTGKISPRLKPLTTKANETLAKKAVDATSSLLLEDLTAADFTPVDTVLSSRLPGLLNDYVERHTTQQAKPKKKVLLYNRAARNHIRDVRSQERNEIIDKFLKQIDPDMLTFYMYVIPELKTRRQQYMYWEPRFRELTREVNLSRSAAAKFKYRTPKRNVAAFTKAKAEAEKVYTAAKRALAAYKREYKTKWISGLKKWMLPYMPASVDVSGVKGSKKILDTTLLQHRLVTRANSRKLKPGDVEMSVKLDKAHALLLSYKGVDRIVDCYGGSTLRASEGVFSEVLDLIKPKLFSIGLVSVQGQGLDTPTGKITDKRILDLNNITQTEEKAYVKQFKKIFSKWNPLKTELSEVMTQVNSSQEVKELEYTVSASSEAQLALHRKYLPDFMSHLHSVDIHLVKSWEVKMSPKVTAALKNAKTVKDLKVIRNVFHGCSQQAGSMILHSGFRLEGTQVTARSMGDVLYLAPCVDKSAQYLGGRGNSRQAGTTGIVFMGDALVSGDPKSSAAQITNKIFGWTKTGSFRTEEIGLVNPNMQFIIRHVFLIKLKKYEQKGEPPNGMLSHLMAKFEEAVPANQYRQT